MTMTRMRMLATATATAAAVVGELGSSGSSGSISHPPMTVPTTSAYRWYSNSSSKDTEGLTTSPCEESISISIPTNSPSFLKEEDAVPAMMGEMTSSRIYPTTIRMTIILLQPPHP